MLKEYLSNIANAIRSHLNTNKKINAQDFSAAIGEVHQYGYAAGKLAILSESKYMHPTISGEIVSMSDVNALNHNLSVSLTSDTLNDFSNISVSRLGKNLATAQEIYTGNTSYDVVEFEGRSCVRFVDNKAIHYDNIPFKPNTQYTVSFEARIIKREEKEGTSGLFYFIYSDGTYTRLVGARNTEFEYFTCTSKAGKTVVSVGTNTHNYVNYNYIDINSFQLEEGTIATEYEPYNSITAITDTDGTVEGLTSLSPNMTLMTDSEGVVINCQYYRDIDLYIDNLMVDVATSGGE